MSFTRESGESRVTLDGRRDFDKMDITIFMGNLSSRSLPVKLNEENLRACELVSDILQRILAL